VNNDFFGFEEDVTTTEMIQATTPFQHVTQWKKQLILFYNKALVGRSSLRCSLHINPEHK